MKIARTTASFVSAILSVAFHAFAQRRWEDGDDYDDDDDDCDDNDDDHDDDDDSLCGLSCIRPEKVR